VRDERGEEPVPVGVRGKAEHRRHLRAHGVIDAEDPTSFAPSSTRRPSVFAAWNLTTRTSASSEEIQCAR
jgi:hypothetical protein